MQSTYGLITRRPLIPTNSTRYTSLSARLIYLQINDFQQNDGKLFKYKEISMVAVDRIELSTYGL